MAMRKVRRPYGRTLLHQRRSFNKRLLARGRRPQKVGSRFCDFGWEAWTRTKIARSRIWSPTNWTTSQPMGDKELQARTRNASSLEPF
jgi:hypothetical protein